MISSQEILSEPDDAGYFSASFLSTAAVNAAETANRHNISPTFPKNGVPPKEPIDTLITKTAKRPPANAKSMITSQRPIHPALEDVSAYIFHCKHKNGFV
ncbi:hypothetical protein BKI51_20455 [Alphaproteobacteria bacterium AO1-B]|nr:hypothetical protein BKI51_20455 [Alphaproteobacteria bacterium AO1-B]